MYVCVWVGMQHSLLLLATVMDTGRGSRSSICYCRIAVSGNQTHLVLSRWITAAATLLPSLEPSVNIR